jgi:hypothetical protein
MRLSTRLAPIELADDRGVAIRLGTFWASRPAVVVFIRHFG